MADSAPLYTASGPAGVAGLILAGGRAARMDEADKGLALLHGEPMVAHVARRLAPQVGHLIISANRNQDSYARYGQTIADDAGLGAWQGPLAGLAAGLALWPEEWVLTAPCDTPFLPQDLAARLIRAAQLAGASLAVARAQGQRHAVCMVVRTSLRADLLDYLAGGDRKVGLWQSRVGAVPVDFDDMPDAFLNINTLPELQQADARYDNQ